MRLCDVGWVWEGQGFTPGVPPSIFGLGDGARFFGLKRCHFLYHATSELALRHLGDMEEVVCDITKWLHGEITNNIGKWLREEGVSDPEHPDRQVSPCAPLTYRQMDFETVRAEAEKISRLSLTYPNVTGAIHDDLLDVLELGGFKPGQYAEVYAALKRHNPNLKLWGVAYAKELEDARWSALAPHIDIVNLWFWPGSGYDDMDKAIEQCRKILPDKPIYMGAYLHNYAKRVPIPMGLVRQRFEGIVRFLEEEKIAGYTILGTAVIDGQLEQAEWIRDFIAQHS